MLMSYFWQSGLEWKQLRCQLKSWIEIVLCEAGMLKSNMWWCDIEPHSYLHLNSQEQVLLMNLLIDWQLWTLQTTWWWKLHDGGVTVALGDRFWLFIQTLNNAKKPFNSIFNSKTKSNYSFKEFIHSKKIPNYSFKWNIHSNGNWIITQGYGRPLHKNSIFSPKNTVLGLTFSQFIHFYYEYRTFLFIQ